MLRSKPYLRSKGVEKLSPNEIASLLKRFGISGSAARQLLLDLWTQAFNTFFDAEKSVSAAGASYLNALKATLGLSDAEVEAARAAVINPIFLRRASELLSRDDAHIAVVREQLQKEALNLGLTADAQKALTAQLTNLAQATLTAILQRTFTKRRISPDETQSVLDFVEYFGLTFEGDDRNKLVRCYHLWMLDQGTLPSQRVDLLLAEGETCAFLGAAVLFENRKPRNSPVGTGELKLIDTGPFYLTNEQILFVGQNGSYSSQYESLVRISESGDALILQKQKGKTQQFTFPSDLDREAARRTIEAICSHAGKKAALTVPAPAQSERNEQRQSEKTKPSVGSSSGVSETLGSLLNELNSLIGLEPVKSEIHSLVNYLRVQRLRLEQGLQPGQITMHLVFTGNPGTGKTTVARLLAKLYKATGFLPEGHLVETARGGLVAGYLGQTALKTSDVIKKALGGVLFIDEAYALVSSSHGADSDMYGKEAIDTLVKAMEDNRDRLVVIVAGYKEPMQQFLTSNPGLRSRFTRYIDFPDYSVAELLTIFQSMAGAEGYQLASNTHVCLQAVLEEAYSKRAATFGNARLARTLFERAKVRLSDRLATDDDITRDELTTLQQADIELLPSDTAA